MFLTATLADDSVLVTDFGADAESVVDPVTPLSAGDIGERMILVPQEINADLTGEQIRNEILELSKTHNTVVLVPSIRWAERWRPHAEVVATTDTIEETIQRLKTEEHVGLVVLVNRYDGIDLPDNACRVLVIDGLPEAFSPEERLDALVTNEDSSIDTRQVQRIEQGMGRAVRSNEDHCVVFLLGPRLAQLTVDPRTEPMFSPATRSQLKLSRTVASAITNRPISNIIDTANQALNRDENWVQLALTALRNIAPAAGKVSDAAVARREAFVFATNGDPAGARTRIESAIEIESDELVVGSLLEMQAIYADLADPELGQQILLLARGKNTNVTKPQAGLAYKPLDTHSQQVAMCVQRITSRYSSDVQLRLDFESVVEELIFDDLRVEQFEEAMREAGFLIGLGSQRPEHDNNGGPDNLWALGDNKFWVIEAKTGARSEAIGKRDMGQLGQSMLWIGERYDPAATHVPVMIHRAQKIYGDATSIPGMRIIREKGLGELAAALRAFSVALASDEWRDPVVVERLLRGHGLLAGQLENFTVPQVGVKS
ncbi:helicase C-terminal domain-containing protein [Planctomonas psychrotolerans]|uniref:helicase C-terminal domain-containing protein n=1 Tax=Planctomonas psychrotolerans TaxID=2528712 RepID=UPI001D0D0F13|nr:helicase C-terminal domain-containing protein [Planctomonas psychrotolerans]